MPELDKKALLAHIENWRMTLENREVSAETILDSFERFLTFEEEPELEDSSV